MVGPEGHRLAVADHVGGNADWLSDLQARMQAVWPAATDAQNDVFFSGSMFWLRCAHWHRCSMPGLSEADFEAEHGQIDGTLAHAFERSFDRSARLADFHLRTVAALMGEPEPDAQDDPFARRC